MNTVSLNGIESVLPIVPAKRVNELVVDHRCREGTLGDIHRLEEPPLVLLDIINFATVQEDILDAVVPTHNVDVVLADDSSVLLAHLAHGLLLNQVEFLIHELVHRSRRATAGDQCVTVGQGHSSGIVQELVVGFRYSLDLPRLGMCVKNDHLVGVAKEADLFRCHLDGPVMNLRHCLDGLFDLLRRKFNLRVSDLNRRKLLCLREQLLFVSFEVVQFVAYVGAFDLFSAQNFDFASDLAHVLLTKMDQTLVLFKVFLFTINARFFKFQGVGVSQFNFSLFYQHLLHDPLKVVIDLLHCFDFAPLYFLGQFVALLD